MHFLNVLFAPAVLYLAYHERKNKGARHILLGMGITIALASIILLAAGGDIVRYLPKAAHTHYLSLVQTGDLYQAYTLFSAYHFIDLANLVMLLAPFTIFLLAIVYLKEFLRNIGEGW